MKELYINNYLCDLPLDVKMAFTSQTNDLEKPDSFQASFIYQFELPKTSINKKIFESADIVGSTTTKPYEKMSAKYVVNGVEIIKYGSAIIEEVSDVYKVSIYSAAFTFFDDIKDKSIKDLDLEDLNHSWTFGNIIATCVGDNPGDISPYDYVYALIDWSTDEYWMNNIARTINTRGLFPCVYVKRMIIQIIEDYGFTCELGVLDAKPFLDLVVPVQSTTAGDAKPLKAIANVLSLRHIYWNPVIGYHGIIFENHVYDPALLFKEESTLAVIPYYTVYNVPFKGTYSFYVRINVISVNPNGYHWWFHIRKNDLLGTNILKYNTYNTSFTGNCILQVDDLALEKGDKIFCTIVINNTVEVTYLYGTFKCIKAEAEGNAYGSTWDIAGNLPDISQLDMLKTVCYQFNAIMDINVLNKVIEFKNLDTLFDNRVLARDWSKKLDLTDDPKIEFRIDGYAKNNWFKYSPDDEVTEGLGDGVLVVQDETLEKEKTIVDLPFAASEMVKRLIDQDVAIIKRCKAGVYDSENFEPRILLISERQEPNLVSYVDGIASNSFTNKYHAYTTFIREKDTYSLGFDANLLDTFYNELSLILKYAKKVTAKFNLKMVDVVDFDHFIPVFVEKFKSMFYVNKINNFTLEKSCETKLIKI